jgi:hypothetical protein
MGCGLSAGRATASLQPVVEHRIDLVCACARGISLRWDISCSFFIACSFPLSPSIVVMRSNVIRDFVAGAAFADVVVS